MTLPSRHRLLAGVLVVGAPLALALLEVFHPHPPHDLFQLDVRTWLWVHYLQIPLFPLAALSVVFLVRGVPGVAAGLCRVAMFAFAVIYTVFDTAAGVVTGVLLRAALETDTPEAWRAPVMAIWEHPILGGSWTLSPPPVLAVAGALAWLVGAAAAAVAVRRAGSSWVPVVLLIVSALGLTAFRTHAWPGGPVSFGALGVAAAWLHWNNVSQPERRVDDAAEPDAAPDPAGPAE
jgi:hypothetical protein